MVRATARSKVIGHSYRDFGSLAQQGGNLPVSQCPQIRSTSCADAMHPLPARRT